MSGLLILQVVPQLFWVRFRDESIYAFRGDGTKIKTSRSRDVGCYFFDAGVISYVFREGTDDMSWAAFTKN